MKKFCLICAINGSIFFIDQKDTRRITFFVGWQTLNFRWGRYPLQNHFIDSLFNRGSPPVTMVSKTSFGLAQHNSKKYLACSTRRCFLIAERCLGIHLVLILCIFLEDSGNSDIRKLGHFFNFFDVQSLSTSSSTRATFSSVIISTGHPRLASTSKDS